MPSRNCHKWLVLLQFIASTLGLEFAANIFRLGESFRQITQSQKKIYTFAFIFWCLSCLIYVVNQIRFVMRRNVASRISSDRWYIVSPNSVLMIVWSHALAFFLFVFGLWSTHESDSIIIAGLVFSCEITFLMLFTS